MRRPISSGPGPRSTSQPMSGIGRWTGDAEPTTRCLAGTCRLCAGAAHSKAHGRVSAGSTQARGCGFPGATRLGLRTPRTSDCGRRGAPERMSGCLLRGHGRTDVPASPDRKLGCSRGRRLSGSPVIAAAWGLLHPAARLRGPFVAPSLTGVPRLPNPTSVNSVGWPGDGLPQK